MPNICLEYLYRDASNYKNWGQAVFLAESNATIAELDNKLREALIDKTFFSAKKSGVPALFFDDWKETDDVTWHEFSELSYTNLPATIYGTIEALIAMLNKNNALLA